MPRIERLEQNTPDWQRWRIGGNRLQRRTGHHGRGNFQNPPSAVGDQDRTGEGICRESGSAAGSRAGAGGKDSIRASV